MASAAKVPSSAREIAKTLTDFCDENGVNHEYLGVNGSGHCILAITFNGKTRKVTFASSPSDNFRGARNALGYLKRTLRDIGWEPEEDDDMGPEHIRTMKFDAQKPSEGPAGPATVKKMPPMKLKGVDIPTPPWGGDRPPV